MLKRIWYACIHLYACLMVRLYFRKVQVHGTDQIPDGPVLFLANHQNSFLDAVLLATTLRRQLHFLVRADVFLRRDVQRALGTLNMMPIYRIRDGVRGVNRNLQVFEKCYQLLGKGNSIVIFPEGSHSLKRYLRPLSKGFTRIALGAASRHTTKPVHIVPVGINYTHHTSFGGSVSVYFGKPVLVPRGEDADDSNGSTQLLVQEATRQMQTLITHIIPVEEYTSLVLKLQPCQPDYLFPHTVNELLERLKSDETPASQPSKPGRKVVTPVFNFFHFAPIWWMNALLKRLNDPVFIGSIRFITGAFIFPLWYGLVGIIAFVTGGGKATLVLWFAMLVSVWFQRPKAPEVFTREELDNLV